MVKSRLRKTFIVSLTSFMALAAALSFTACGKSSEKEDTPEYVYEAKFNDLGAVGVDYVDESYINDSNIYMTGSHYDYNEKDESGTSKSYFMKCAVDSEKIDMIEIDGLEKDEYTSKLLTDENGGMHLLTYIYKYNEKTGKSKTKYYMQNISEDGKLSDRVEMKPESNDNEFYPGNSVVYVNEKLIVVSELKVYVFNKDGSLDNTIEMDNYIDTLFAANDGKIYIMAYMEKVSGMGICELDLETGEFGEPIDFGDYSIYNIRNIALGENNVVYLGNEDSVFKCDFDKNEIEPLFSWINVDIDGNNVSNFCVMEDESVVVLNVSYNYDDAGSGGASSNVEIVNIDKKKYSETKQKKRLTLAAYYIDSGIKQEILKFNKSSEDYRIEIKSYYGYEEPQKQMNLDIISGSIPDIIELSYLPKSLYIKKGIFTDLYPFIEKDDEIKKDDFVDSVITTLEHDGKLYYLPTSFGISAYAGSKKIFGDMEGWTYEEMAEKYESLPKGGVFAVGMTSEWFIQNILGAQMGDFINYETGEVNIDTEEFIQMLEFSKNFKTNDEYMKEYEENRSENEDAYTLIKNGKLLLNDMYLYDFSDIQVNEKLFKSQGGYNVISLPSNDGNNKLTMYSSASGTCMAISEKCDDKEGAWQFLRRLYTYEFQKSPSRYNGFPVRKDALEKKIEYAMAAEAYTDDDGTKVEPVAGDTYSMDSFTVEIKPYTEEQMDLFRSLVDRIGRETNYDTTYEDITEIINEETEAFFAGDKTAKETAEVLQSRIKIYVSENF